MGPLVRDILVLLVVVVTAVLLSTDDLWRPLIRRKVSRPAAARQSPPTRKPIDWAAVAEVEHELWPEGVPWMHSCRDTWRHVTACADTPAGQEEKQMAAFEPLPGLLEVGGPLTDQEQAEIARRFWRAEARPMAVISPAGGQQVTVRPTRRPVPVRDQVQQIASGVNPEPCDACNYCETSNGAGGLVAQWKVEECGDCASAGG